MGNSNSSYSDVKVCLDQDIQVVSAGISDWHCTHETEKRLAVKQLALNFKKGTKAILQGDYVRLKHTDGYMISALRHDTKWSLVGNEKWDEQNW